MFTHIQNFWQALCDDHSYERLRRILFVGHVGIILLLILIASVHILGRTTFIPLTLNSDARQYIETAQHFTGDTTVPVHGNRLLKPLAPLAIAVFTPHLDGNHYTALEFLSILFYYLLAVLIYYFAYHFLRRRDEAFVATLVYITSYPMLMYGLDLYTETGAWFFHLLGLFYAVKYFRMPTYTYALMSAAAITVGFLWKEYAALAGLALGLMILLAHTSWKQKIAHVAATAALALPILTGWQVYVYHVYDYTYLDWFIVGHGEPEKTSQFKPLYILKSLMALMLLGWLLVLGGVLKWHTFAQRDRIPGIVSTLTSLGFLSWGYVSSRLYFVLAPTLAVLAGRGIRWCSSHMLKILITLCVVCTNYAWLVVANMPAVRAWLAAL